MPKQGWIEAEWRETGLGPRAKFYTLTADGTHSFGAREASYWATRGLPNIVLFQVAGNSPLAGPAPNGQHG
jgi:DNA-binding PadR family transcriptional regulator